MTQPLFPLGRVVATSGAIEALKASNETALPYLQRHVAGEWGEVDTEDQAANNCSVKNGTRILSAYPLKSGVKIWIITEADRSATTLLLPDEY